MMSFCLRTVRAVFVFTFVLLAGQGAAWAHPHSWIDISTDVEFAADGTVKALHLNWLFDEGYTVFILENLAGEKASAPDAATFQNIADKITGNLAPFGYFTKTLSQGKATEAAELSETHSKIKDNRLSLDLTLTFPHPVPANGFGYKTFDPTYYVEMLHVEGNAPVHLQNAPKGCAYTLTPPNPPADAVIQAASMARDSVADSTLGIMFAESVTISCP